QPLQLTPDRGRADQAVTRRRGRARFEGLSGRDHGLLDLRGESPRRGARGSRMVGEVGVGVVLNLAPPLVQPARAAVQGLTDVADTLAQEAPAHGLAAQGSLGCWCVHDSSSAEESCEDSERGPERAWLLASERGPERANRNDVLSVDNYSTCSRSSTGKRTATSAIPRRLTAIFTSRGLIISWRPSGGRTSQPKGRSVLSSTRSKRNFRAPVACSSRSPRSVRK